MLMIKTIASLDFHHERGRHNGCPLRRRDVFGLSSSVTAAYFKASTQHLPDFEAKNVLLELQVRFFFSDAKFSKRGKKDIS